jgi:hypothetical protein
VGGRVSVESGTQPGVLGFVRPLPRPPSERFCGPPTPGQVAEHDQLWRRVRARIEELTTKHEPPAVGAEVSWSEAKADMQRRREARYNHRTLRMTSPGSEYAWGGGALVTRTGGGNWSTSSYSEEECADPLRRWVRLA